MLKNHGDGYLKKETEGMIFTASEQAPRTDSVKCYIDKISNFPLYGLREKRLESVWCIVSAVFVVWPLPKSKRHLAWLLCSGIISDRLTAARGAFQMHSTDPVELHVHFAIQPSGLQVRVISRHSMYVGCSNLAQQECKMRHGKVEVRVL